MITKVIQYIANGISVPNTESLASMNEFIQKNQEKKEQFLREIASFDGELAFEEQKYITPTQIQIAKLEAHLLSIASELKPKLEKI